MSIAAPMPSAPEGRLAGSVRMAEVQRARILAAMVDTAAELGFAEATVGRVVQRAGISRRTFYEQFGGRDECFLAALDAAGAELGARMERAYNGEGEWRQRIRAAVVELLLFCQAEPACARLLVVESLAAGPAACERRARLLAGLGAAVAQGQAAGRSAQLSPLTAEGTVGAAAAILHSRLTEGSRTGLLGLVNPLVSMIVLPYLGPAAARRELTEPVVSIAPPEIAPSGDALSASNIRLTYRTMQVVLAVGSQPGASNRDIGMAAGITDQGQISKLLRRLQERGLLQNTGEGHARGTCNAWVLTQQGQELHRVLAGRTGV